MKSTAWRWLLGLVLASLVGVALAFRNHFDAAALQAALGAPPAHPDAAAIQAHLESLIARSRALNADHLGSLLPRLQAECATPLSLPELKAACSRAQDRWEHQTSELDALAGLISSGFGEEP